MAILNFACAEDGVVQEPGSVFGTVQISAAQARTGAKSFEIPVCDDWYGEDKNGIVLNSPDRAEFYAQGSLFPTCPATWYFNSNGWKLLAWRNGTTVMGCITLDYHSTGMKVYVGDKATLVGTIGDGIVVNNWTTLEVRVVVGASGTIQVRMNGLVVFTFNGNTQPGTATTINNMVYYVVPMWNHGAGLASTYWDDLLINDALGSKFNSWPNGVKIHRRKMVSAGTYAQWTPQGAETNVACVNEDVPSMDTYVEPTAPGQKDSYVPEDAPEGLTGIAAVAFRYWGQGGGNIKRLCRLDGTDYLGDPLSLSGSFNHVDDFMYTKPGGGGWDVPTFNAIEAGMEGE